MVYTRTVSELSDLLAEQISFLRGSCGAYDNGNRNEAKRIATAIYTMVHDGSQQKSLLRLLRIRDKLSIPDCTIPKIGEEIFFPTVVGTEPGKQAHFFPHLYAIEQAKQSMPRLKYSKWVVGKMFVNINGKALTRQNTIMAIRNQDGGSHVDENLKDETYHWLMTRGTSRAKAPRDGSLSFIWDPVTQPDALDERGVLRADRMTMVGEPVRDGHLAVMRVIGWELNEALTQLGW